MNEAQFIVKMKINVTQFNKIRGFKINIGFLKIEKNFFSKSSVI